MNTLKISKDQFTRSPNQSRRGDATCHMCVGGWQQCQVAMYFERTAAVLFDPEPATGAVPQYIIIRFLV